MKLKRGEWMRVLLERAAQFGWQRKTWDFAQQDLAADAERIGLRLSDRDMTRLKDTYETAFSRI